VEIEHVALGSDIDGSTVVFDASGLALIDSIITKKWLYPTWDRSHHGRQYHSHITTNASLMRPLSYNQAGCYG